MDSSKDHANIADLIRAGGWSWTFSLDYKKTESQERFWVPSVRKTAKEFIDLR